MDWLGLNAVDSRESKIKTIVKDAFSSGKCKLIIPEKWNIPSGKKAIDLWGFENKHLTSNTVGDTCPIITSHDLEIKVEIRDAELQTLIGYDRMTMSCDVELKVTIPVTADYSKGFAHISGTIHSLQKGNIDYFIGVDGSGIYKDENESKIKTAEGQMKFMMALPGYNAEIKAATIVTDSEMNNTYSVNSKSVTEKEAESYFK